jgi:hypothetical protein
VQHDLAGPVKTDSSFWTIGETQNFNNHVDIDFPVSFASIICTFLFPFDLNFCAAHWCNVWSGDKQFMESS